MAPPKELENLPLCEAPFVIFASDVISEIEVLRFQMKRILELVKGGHYVRMPVYNLTECPHAEWLIRQRPWKENKKMSCIRMGDLSFTTVDTYLFFICDEFPERGREEGRVGEKRRDVPPPAHPPSTAAHPAGQSAGLACRGEQGNPIDNCWFSLQRRLCLYCFSSFFQNLLAVSILSATLAGKLETS